MRRKKIKRISQQTHDSRQELAHFKYFYSCKRHTYLLLLSFPKVALFLFKTIKGLKKKKQSCLPKRVIVPQITYTFKLQWWSFNVFL